MSWEKVNEERRSGIKPVSTQVKVPPAGMGGAISRRIAKAGK